MWSFLRHLFEMHFMLAQVLYKAIRACMIDLEAQYFRCAENLKIKRMSSVRMIDFLYRCDEIILLHAKLKSDILSHSI